MSELFKDHEKVVNDLFHQTEKTETFVQKTVTRTLGAILMIWFISAIIVLLMTGGLTYVAIHFISKYW